MIRLRGEELTFVEIAYFFSALALAIVNGIGVGSLAGSAALSGLVVAAPWALDRLGPEGRTRRVVLVLDEALADSHAARQHLERRLGTQVRAVAVLEVDFVRETTRLEVEYAAAARPAPAAAARPAPAVAELAESRVVRGRLLALARGLPPVGLGELGAHAALSRRTERKYVVDAAVLTELVGGLARSHRVLEVGGARLVRYESVYFDTPQLLATASTSRGVAGASSAARAATGPTVRASSRSSCARGAGRAPSTGSSCLGTSTASSPPSRSTSSVRRSKRRTGDALPRRFGASCAARSSA